MLVWSSSRNAFHYDAGDQVVFLEEIEGPAELLGDSVLFNPKLCRASRIRSICVLVFLIVPITMFAGCGSGADVAHPGLAKA